MLSTEFCRPLLGFRLRLPLNPTLGNGGRSSTVPPGLFLVSSGNVAREWADHRIASEGHAPHRQFLAFSKPASSISL
jgi:hypothetical protein